MNHDMRDIFDSEEAALAAAERVNLAIKEEPVRIIAAFAGVGKLIFADYTPTLSISLSCHLNMKTTGKLRLAAQGKMLSRHTQSLSCGVIGTTLTTRS